MKYPIYIPSLGRYDNMRTVKMLLNAGITNFYVVIERDEVTEYMRHYPGEGTGPFIVLPKSDYGTSTVARNFCIEHAKKNGHTKLWMLDDDITRVFMHNKGKKMVTVSVKDCFERIENFVVRCPNVRAVGVRTSASFLKDVKKDLQLNCSLSSLYLLTVDKFRFRGTMLVDMDYQLQILRAGFQTLRMENFAFSFITPTKIKGGYYDIYTNDEKRTKAIQQFLKYNPDVEPTIARNSTGFLVLKNISKIWRKFK